MLKKFFSSKIRNALPMDETRRASILQENWAQDRASVQRENRSFSAAFINFIGENVVPEGLMYNMIPSEMRAFVGQLADQYTRRDVMRNLGEDSRSSIANMNGGHISISVGEENYSIGTDQPAKIVTLHFFDHSTGAICSIDSKSLIFEQVSK